MWSQLTRHLKSKLFQIRPAVKAESSVLSSALIAHLVPSDYVPVNSLTEPSFLTTLAIIIEEPRWFIIIVMETVEEFDRLQCQYIYRPTFLRLIKILISMKQGIYHVGWTIPTARRDTMQPFFSEWRFLAMQHTK